MVVEKVPSPYSARSPKAVARGINCLFAYGGFAEFLEGVLLANFGRLRVFVPKNLFCMTLPTQPSLRLALESDIPFLLKLWHETMSVHFAAAGISSADENPLGRLYMRFECAAIVSLQTEPVGFLKVARDGKEWTLIQIALAPFVQGLGLGTFLINSLIDEAQAHSASLNLSVLKCNPALAMYRRLGFSIIGEENFAYNMRYGGAALVSETTE